MDIQIAFIHASELCCERVFGFKTLLKLKLLRDLLCISRI